jgi:hypothetical protein
MGVSAQNRGARPTGPRHAPAARKIRNFRGIHRSCSILGARDRRGRRELKSDAGSARFFALRLFYPRAPDRIRAQKCRRTFGGGDRQQSGDFSTVESVPSASATVKSQVRFSCWSLPSLHRASTCHTPLPVAPPEARLHALVDRIEVSARFAGRLHRRGPKARELVWLDVAYVFTER